MELIKIKPTAIISIKELESNILKIFETIGANATPIDPVGVNIHVFNVEYLKDSFSQIDLEDYDFTSEDVEKFEKILSSLNDYKYLILEGE